MQDLAKLVLSATMALSSLHVLSAQDLRPRAYTITPLHSNAVTLGYAFNDGSIYFGTLLPITNATGQYSLPNLSYYHSFSFFKRLANASATLPYVVGTFQGDVGETGQQQIYRSGLADSVFRCSVNLLGGPAMPAKEFLKWKQKTLLGASLQIVAPTGQYYPSHLINPGFNRWAFKPELGYSRAWGKYVFDAYAGVWLFTANNNYLNGGEFSQTRNTLNEAPLGSIEMHLSYDVKPRMWISIDGNYWYGGSTTVNGVHKLGTLESDSRIGTTFSVPFTKHQSAKFSYSDGALARIGGTFQTVSVAWQYSWLGRPN
jgi:hypothetical protein